MSKELIRDLGHELNYGQGVDWLDIIFDDAVNEFDFGHELEIEDYLSEGDIKAIEQLEIEMKERITEILQWGLSLSKEFKQRIENIVRMKMLQDKYNEEGISYHMISWVPVKDEKIREYKEILSKSRNSEWFWNLLKAQDEMFSYIRENAIVEDNHVCMTGANLAREIEWIKL